MYVVAFDIVLHAQSVYMVQANNSGGIGSLNMTKFNGTDICKDSKMCVAQA